MLSRTSIGFAPKSFEELWNFAQQIAKTDFVPTAIRGNAGAVLAACRRVTISGCRRWRALAGSR